MTETSTFPVAKVSYETLILHGKRQNKLHDEYLVHVV